MRHRLSYVAGVGALALLLSMTATPAWAGPGQDQGQGCNTCVTVTSNATRSLVARGGTAHLSYDVAVTGGAATQATLQTHQDPDLPADAATVTIDGIPAAAVSAVGGNLTIELPTAGSLAAGDTVTVMFDATVNQAAEADLVSWASVTFDNGAATANSADQVVPLLLPDLAIGPAPALSIDRGSSVTAGVGIQNNNASVLSAAALTLTFPAGLSLGSAGVSDAQTHTALTCISAVSVTTCIVPQSALSPSGSLNIPVAVSLMHAIGSTPGVQATLAPPGIDDADPSNNSTVIPVTVIGRSHLSYRITLPSGRSFGTTGSATIPLGQPVLVTATITNTGPDPAPDTAFNVGIQGLVAPNFSLADPDSTPLPAGAHFVTTSPQTLAPGESVSRALLITGLTLRATTLFGTNLANTGSFDPNPQSDTPDGRIFAASVLLTVGPALATPVTSDSDGLANTGSPTGELVLFGVALLVGGAATTAAGRRPRRATS